MMLVVGVRIVRVVGRLRGGQLVEVVSRIIELVVHREQQLQTVQLAVLIEIVQHKVEVALLFLAHLAGVHFEVVVFVQVLLKMPTRERSMSH